LCLQCFYVVGWVARKASGLEKLSGEVLACFVRARCKRFAYSSPDAIVIPSSLASLKCRMVYLSDASLPRLSWKRGH